jgi:RNA polymerase sigma-70 factor (ECF subfamily)
MAPEQPGFSFESVFNSTQLQLGMRFLTEDQQQVVALKFAEGLSNAEVAEIMGKTEGAIKALQHRALCALRNIVQSQVEA